MAREDACFRSDDLIVGVGLRIDEPPPPSDPTHIRHGIDETPHRLHGPARVARRRRRQEHGRAGVQPRQVDVRRGVKGLG